MPGWISDFVARSKGQASPRGRDERLDLVRLNRIELDLESYVYFVQSAPTHKAMGLIKIGCSNDPKRRLSDLRNSGAVDLVVLGLVRGGSPLESELHLILRTSRAHGEWFHPTVHVATVIHDVLNSRLRVSEPVEPLDIFVARVAGKLTLGVPGPRP